MKLKHIRPDKMGDSIKVEVRDPYFNKIYERESQTAIKPLSELINDLIIKGVPIDKAVMFNKKKKTEIEQLW